jgi:hypothetical protein
LRPNGERRFTTCELERAIEVDRGCAETLKALVGLWAGATREDRMGYVRLFLLPEGLRYDLPHQRILALQPHAVFLQPLRLVLIDWTEKDGVLWVGS